MLGGFDDDVGEVDIFFEGQEDKIWMGLAMVELVGHDGGGAWFSSTICLIQCWSAVSSTILGEQAVPGGKNCCKERKSCSLLSPKASG